MDSETRIQVLRDAAGAKLPQCTNPFRPETNKAFTKNKPNRRESVMEGFGVLLDIIKGLLYTLKRYTNKWWVRAGRLVSTGLSRRATIRVPAAAVIPAPRVVTTFTGLKAFVAGAISS